MIGILYKNGSYAEVPGAAAGLDDEDHLICWGDDGTIVARLPVENILVYGRSEITHSLAQDLNGADLELELDKRRI